MKVCSLTLVFCLGQNEPFLIFAKSGKILITPTPQCETGLFCLLSKFTFGTPAIALFLIILHRLGLGLCSWINQITQIGEILMDKRAFYLK